MADFANIKIGQNVYGVKDKTARDQSSSAETKADLAIQNVESLKVALPTSTLNGVYTTQTETLEITLNIVTDAE